MILKNLRQTIEQQLAVVYHMMPNADKQNKHLVSSYERKNWTQFLIVLQEDYQVSSYSIELRKEIELLQEYVTIYRKTGLVTALRQSSKEDIQIIGECLQAIVYGSFLPERHFQTLMGLGRDEVAAMANIWPNVDAGDEKVATIVNNTLNSLLGYPHRADNEWSKFISVSRHECDNVYKKWRLLIKGGE